MSGGGCCENPSLAWQASRVGEQWADVYTCASCGTIHKTEKWYVPMYLPQGSRGCVNCGGTFSEPPKKPKGMSLSAKRPGEPDDQPRCDTCGLTDVEVERTLEGLAALHPQRDYVAGAAVAAEFGRHVLALKLSSAALCWEKGDPDEARQLRLQALISLGLLDNALDEAYEWSRQGAPTTIWSTIAELEVTAGNFESAVKALRWGMEVNPTNHDMRADSAELYALMDDYGHAIRVAKDGVKIPEIRDRCIGVLSEVGDKLYDEGKYYDAIGAVQEAGEFQKDNAAICWLHARVSAQEQDLERAIEWLEATLKLQPNHAEARAALEKLRPGGKKRGWLW
jgi:tetratricopeptide (TPR) repeat protein